MIKKCEAILFLKFKYIIASKKKEYCSHSWKNSDFYESIYIYVVLGKREESKITEEYNDNTMNSRYLSTWKLLFNRRMSLLKIKIDIFIQYS